MNINLVPFRTIKDYVYLLIKRTNPYLVPHAFINLFGNIAFFIPLGFFLPCFWEKLKKFRYFLSCIVTTIVSIELIQVFTLRGSCDIDDLILNVIGSIIGFVVFRFIQIKTHCRQYIR